MQKLLTVLCLLSSFLLLDTNTLLAQKTTIENVKRIRLKSSGSIINDGIIQGYYFFYKVDRVDRKTNAYKLEIFNQNLERISSKKIEGPKHYVLQEGVYNGSSIMLKFYDYKGKKFDFKQYDQNSDLLSSVSIDTKKRFAMVKSTTGNDGEIVGTNLFSIPNTGFANILINKNKKIGYQINFFPENGEKGWTFNSPVKSKELQFAEFLGADDGIVLLSVIKKKNAMSKQLSYFVLGLDTKTGDVLFEKPFNNENKPMQIMNGYVDSETKNLNLFGLYFKKGGKPMKDKSLGLFAYTLDRDGKTKSKKYISWAKHVSKLLPSNDKGKIDGVGYIHFHKFTKCADGKILAIGEQYKKAASALGIASKMLGGDGSVVKIVVKDLYMFEFNPDFTLNSVEVFEKGKTDVGLPEGSLLYGPQRLAQLVDAYNGFDYKYTQRNQDNSVLTVGYVDYERRKGEKNKFVFGAATYADGEYSSDTIELGSRAYNLSVLPAKPGYVVVLEYFRKKKTLDIRLEKINF